MTHAEFVGAYQANFGEFPSKKEDESSWWWRLADQIPVNYLTKLIETVEAMRENTRAKPRLELFKRAWEHIKISEGRYSDRPPSELCALCVRGWLTVPAAQHESGGWVFTLTPGLVLNWVAFPCLCTEGRTRRGRNSQIDAACQEAKMALLDYRKAAGHRQEFDGITREQFLTSTSAGFSPNGLMHDMILRSHIDAGLIPAIRLEQIHSGRGEQLKTWLKALHEPEPAPEPEREVASVPVFDASWHLVGDVAAEVVAAARKEEADTSFSFGANAKPEEKREEEEEKTYGYPNSSLPF